MKAELAVRPPWALEEAGFVDSCTRCFNCAQACPSHLIVKGEGGFPKMSFLRQGCDYCEACVQACPEIALSFTQQNQQQPWQQLAIINQNCFSARGIICRSCSEVCESQAIEFKLLVGGASQVSIKTATCNGCGECIHVCPAEAIQIQKSTIPNQPETIHE